MTRMGVVAALIVIVVPLVTFWTIVFGHDTLYPSDLLHETFLPFAAGRSGTNVQVTAINDYIVSYYPARTFIHESLRAGRLPLWNPRILGGQPSFANWGSIPTFDPFNVLYLLPSLPTALAWRTLLQDIACAAFMALYASHLGVRPLAAAFGGLAFALNSMFYANIFDYALGGMLWLPLVLLAVERGLPHPTLRGALPAALVLGVALLSCPMQFYADTLLAVAVIGSATWYLRYRADVSLARCASYLGGIAVLAILVSAVQLLPGLELLATSVRKVTDSGQGIRAPREMLTGTLALVTFVFPNLGGNLKGGLLLAQAWGGTTHYQGYIGVSGFVCAALAAWALPWRRTAPYVLLGLGTVALVLYTPLSMFLYERAFILYVFSASVLAAMGLDYLAGEGRDARRIRPVLRVLVGGFAVVAAGVLVWTIVFLVFRGEILARADAYIVSILPGRYLGNNVALHLQKMRNTLSGLTLLSPGMLVLLGAGFGAAGLVALRVRDRLSGSAFTAAATTLATVELVFMAWTHVPFVDQRVYPLFPPTPAVELLRQDPGLFRVFSIRKYGEEPPLLSVGIPSVYGLYTVEGKENLYPQNLLTILPPELHSDTNRVPERFALLDAANVKYVVTGPTTALPGERFERVFDAAVRVYRNRLALPRAFAVWDYRVVPRMGDALSAIRDPGFEPARAVILDRDPVPRPEASPGRDATIRVSVYHATEVEVQAAMPAAGLVVLSDVYYPGWAATVDGAPAAILRANAAMRAVSVPRGGHVVRFVFTPASLRWGLAISAVTLVVILSAWAVALLWSGGTAGRSRGAR